MSLKKNYIKIPSNIHAKLEKIESREVVVGCIIKFSKTDLEQRDLSHLQIRLDDHGLHYPGSIIPPKESGKYSSWNVNGREVVQKDLPKETYYRHMDAPNWGGYGTHTVSIPGERYQRMQIAPRNSRIDIQCVDGLPGKSHYAIRFQVSEVLNRDEPAFKERLLECINLLQENVGYCGVEESTITMQEYIATLNVSWDILPPGTIEEAKERLFSGKKPTQQEIDVADKRYGFFKSLNPKAFIFGRSGLLRYFGALIQDDFVIFENIEYGNAIYIMFEDWKELSQKNRVDLLSGSYGKKFERIIHKGTWEKEVRAIIKNKLKGKQIPGVRRR